MNKFNFENYLIEKQFDKTTIKKHLKQSGLFLEWLKNQQLKATETKYNDILEFINFCKKKGKNTVQINYILVSIRHYYSYLQKYQSSNIKNPASGIKIIGTTKKLPVDLLKPEQLETIYNNYKSKKRANKIILGLIIYQGLSSSDLSKLETSHINLRAGKIFVPGGKRKNSRKLKLGAHQILELQEYLEKIRPKLSNKTNLLFLDTKSGNTDISKVSRLRHVLNDIIKQTKKENPKINIRSSYQLRESVITNWLKHYNLREVQYFAGQKKVSSTERYQETNIEDLQRAIKKCHPLK